MSYAESQKKFCRFVAGHYVVMTRAWKKGERGFNVLWDITRARYIGRKLLVINVHQHALEVQPVNGRDPFLVPWFVLEDFQQFQPVMPPVANNDDPEKDVIESIAEGMALKVANYSGVVTRVPNSTEVVYLPNESSLADKMQSLASDIRDATSGKSFVSGTLEQIANNLGLNEPPKKLSSVVAIWKDGAVCRPNQSHVDSDGLICLFSKTTGGLDWARIDCDQFAEHYWLDTTTPTELTPQEAFELLRVVYPQLHRIRDEGDGFAMMEGSPLNACIKWNGETQYPPRERWRVPTDEDKGSKCRAWSTEKREWVDAIFISTWQDAFVAKVSYWPFPVEFPKCEVLVDESN